MLGLPSGLIDPTTLVLFVVAALLLFGVTAALGPGDPLQSRRMRARMDRTRAGRVAAPSSDQAEVPTSVRRAKQKGLFENMSFFSNVMPKRAALRSKLDRAGISMGAIDFAVMCVVAGAAIGAAAVVFAGLSPLVGLLVGTVFATGVPNLYLKGRINRRSKKFLAMFPEAIDLIVRGVRSGLPVVEAINAIGQEMQEPVAGAFREIGNNIKIGVNLNEALWAVADKVQMQEFKFFVISLSIQQETGGNLSEILQNLSSMIRRREQVKLKIKAMSSEAKASAMIIGSLPFVMGTIIFIINSDYILKLFIDPRGWMLLGVGATSMLLGLGIMAKMVKFEI